jgi:hypothetical protein
VSDHQVDYPIATMCRVLGVSPSGYYAWRKRRPSPRSKTDAARTAEIRAAHATSRGIYGAPRIHAELASKSVCVGRKRVARLMSKAGLAGVSRRKFVITTVKGDGRQTADLVEQNFTALAPERQFTGVRLPVSYLTPLGAFSVTLTTRAFDPRRLTLVCNLLLQADCGGPTPISHAACCGTLISATHSRAGASAAKLLLTRSGAGRPSPLIVVVTNLRRLAPARPACEPGRRL